MFQNQFGDSIDMDPDQYSLNFEDPYTINPDPHHCKMIYFYVCFVSMLISVSLFVDNTPDPDPT